MPGRLDDGADDHRQLEAAKLGERLERLKLVRATCRRGLQQSELAIQARIVQPRAAPNALGERQLCDPMHEHRSRCRVPDAHLTEQQRVAAIGNRGSGEATPALIAASRRLLRRHRRLVQVVASSRPVIAIDEAWCSSQRVATPASITASASPSCRARTLIAAPPDR